MLQLGRELPEVAGQEASYCTPEGANYSNSEYYKNPTERKSVFLFRAHALLSFEARVSRISIIERVRS
jgi:hypothetical protein